MTEIIKFRQNELKEEEAQAEANKIAGKRLEMIRNILKSELGKEAEAFSEEEVMDLAGDSVDYQRAHDSLVAEGTISQPQDIKILGVFSQTCG